MVSAGFVLSPSLRAAGIAVPGLLLLAATATGCGGPRHDPVQATGLPRRSSLPEARAAEGVWHVLEAGQTLWRIALVYAVPLDELARANDIDDPTTLAIGHRLFVPGAREVLCVPPYPEPIGRPLATSPRPVGRAFGWPVLEGRILSGFGAPRDSRRHRGIDIGASPGQPVYAARSGRVVYSGSTLRGYGKTIIIDHGRELRSLYAHNSALVAVEGEWVKRGELIARVGRTGNASTDHCHFEIRKNDVPVDPLPYLGGPAGSAR